MAEIARQRWSAARYAETAHFVPALGDPVLEMLAPSPGAHFAAFACEHDRCLRERRAAPPAADGAAIARGGFEQLAAERPLLVLQRPTRGVGVVEDLPRVDRQVGQSELKGPAGRHVELEIDRLVDHVSSRAAVDGDVAGRERECVVRGMRQALVIGLPGPDVGAEVGEAGLG